MDETYWKCREKLRIKAPPEDEPGKKAQRSKAKSIRSYVFGVITPKVCIYLHFWKGIKIYLNCCYYNQQ